LIWIFQQTPRTSLVFRSKLTKRLLVSPTSFMSVKSPTNILLHKSATVNVLSTGRIVHGTICLERNFENESKNSAWLRVAGEP
jgi:hypothetical protein